MTRALALLRHNQLTLWLSVPSNAKLTDPPTPDLNCLRPTGFFFFFFAGIVNQVSKLITKLDT